MAVHFKFRSSVDYDSLQIDDQFISVANLKDKIIEQKNLGNSLGFNLVITDAESGEEYDETFLVPKNTSVIIKRVPAAQDMLTLQANESLESFTEIGDNTDTRKNLTPMVQPCPLFREEIDTMDEFGLDLYAIPEFLNMKGDVDEKTKLSSFLTKSTTEWPRQAEDFTEISRGHSWAGYGRGLGRGGRTYLRSTPPPGYVCHRCGLLGHLIQHCATNDDTSYDSKRVKMPVGIPRTRLKVDQEGTCIIPGSVGVMQPDETAFRREADTFLPLNLTVRDPPSELRCSLCNEIFRDAVMIPCCHYSFCDTCVRQDLITKGKCPQCGSVKFKNDDLLPNIALRQAIIHFLELEDSGQDEANKQKPVSDICPALHIEVPAAPPHQLQMDLRRPCALSSAPSPGEAMRTATTAECNPVNFAVCEAMKASNNLQSLNRLADAEFNEGQISKEVGSLADVHLPAANEVFGSLKLWSKKIVIDGFEGFVVSKGSEPSIIREAEDVALESKVSKGKRKKRNFHQMPVDGGIEYAGHGKPRKGDRCCFACGSSQHLARDCTTSAGPYLFYSGNFPPGGQMPVGVIPPYGSEMLWHGSYMPPLARPLSVGLHGHPGPAMPFTAPVFPPRPFFPSYVSSFYQRPPMHSHCPYPGIEIPAGVGQAERPLSREEFLELQERERRHRVRVQERFTEEKGMQNAIHETSTVDFMTCSPIAKEQTELHKREMDRGSVRNCSDENNFTRSKRVNSIRKHSTDRLCDNEANWKPSSPYEAGFSSYDNMKSRKSDRLLHSRQSWSLDEQKASSRHHKHGNVNNKHDSDLDNNKAPYMFMGHQTKKSRDSVHEQHSKFHSRKQVDESINDVDIITREDSYSTCQNVRKHVYDSSKLSHCRESKVIDTMMCTKLTLRETKGKRDELQDCVVNEDDAWGVSVVKRRHHHSHSKSTIDVGHVHHESDDKAKKKKKHPKKYCGASSSYETTKEPKIDHEFVALSHYPKHHRHKPRYVQHMAESCLVDSLEDSRWQLESGDCVI